MKIKQIQKFSGLDAYAYGFNGMERDDEVSGSGNHIDFGARGYDSRRGQWWTIDPQAKKQPGWSPYKAFLNNPILYVDPDGETEYITIITENKKTGETSIEFTKADRVMTDGKKHIMNVMGVDIAGFNNYYYDYATTTLRTVGTDGSVTESTRTDILYSNGVKDKDVVFMNGSDYGDTKRETWEFFGGHNDGGLLVFGSGADNQNSIGPKVRMPWGNFDFDEFSSIMGKVNTAMKSKKDYNLNKKFEFPAIKATSLLNKVKSLVEYSNEHRENWVTCPTCSKTDSSHIDDLHGAGTFDSLKTEAEEGQ